MHLTYNQEAWGHLIVRLLDDLPAAVTVPPILVEQGRVLDTFYIPTRHPDSHPAGSPFEHFGPLQSEDAIRYARAIAEFVRNTMAQS